MSDLKLQEPQRQSPVGVGVMFLQNLRRALNFFLAVVLVQLGANFQMLGLNIWDWAYLLAGIFLVISYLQYRRFFFYVRQDQFIIEKGVLRREKLNIPFDRIQTVNTTQNLFQQALGVVGLKIDTAGSAVKEIEIPALQRAYAQNLQAYLQERRSQELAEEATELSSAENSRPLRKPLVQLNFIDLLKVGFTENHLRSGFVLFAVVNGYLWQYEEYLLKPFEGYLEKTADTILTSWVLLLPFALLAFLVVSVFFSLARVILRFFNLQFYLAKDGVTLDSGLLKRNVFRLPEHKIQYFRWSSNPLRQMIGYRTLRIKQAGSAETAERKALEIPGIKARPLVKVLQTFYPQRKRGFFLRYQAHRLLFIQYFTWLVFLPAAAFAGFFIFQSFPWFFQLPILLYLFIASFWVYRYCQSVKMRVNAEVLELARGWFIPKRVCIPHEKLQNLRLRQSVFQRRRALASLDFFTAAGAERMPHLPLKEARSLYNYLLFKIENSQRPWM